MLEQLQARFPDLQFVADERFCWSPLTQQIGYDASRDDEAAGWSLLHETGHALLGHDGYQGGFELLQLELAAWQKARSIATDLGVTIDEEHIEDCLDTYRDWLNKRSVCPTCSNRALQQNDHVHYRCFNCHNVWRVTPSRFCRAYRSSKNVGVTPARSAATVFSTQLSS